MKAKLRRTLVTGLVIILPLFVTAWVVYFLFRQIDSLVTPVVLGFFHALGLGEWREVAWLDYVAPVISVTLALLIIYLLGLVGSNVLGRQLLTNVDRFLMQVPLVRGIYSATRQFLDSFANASSKAFQRVVLVEYPRRGLWTLGLVTSEARGEVQVLTQQRVVGVFVPTTPNPTSGWLLFVPESDIVYLDMSVDDAFKMIISGGVLTPTYAGGGALPLTVADAPARPHGDEGEPEDEGDDEPRDDGRPAAPPGRGMRAVPGVTRDAPPG